MIDNDVTDFPEPDSPTMPIISFLCISKETSFTAFTIPDSVLNSVTRFLTSMSKLFSMLQI